jgi:triacylglycerol lipase
MSKSIIRVDNLLGYPVQMTPDHLPFVLGFRSTMMDRRPRGAAGAAAQLLQHFKVSLPHESVLLGNPNHQQATGRPACRLAYDSGCEKNAKSRVAQFLGASLLTLLWVTTTTARQTTDREPSSATTVATEADEAVATEPSAEKAATGIELPSETRMTGARVLKDVPFATPDQQTLRCDVYLPLAKAEPAPEAERASIDATEQATGQQGVAKTAHDSVGAQRGDASDRSGRRPAVVLVHGGGWAGGDKWSVGSYARALAEQGVVAISINYRLAPEFKFPAQIDDVRDALVWVAENADQFDIDTQRIGLFGYSAGAHLSCMVGTLADASWDSVQATTQWPKDDPRWKKLPQVCVVVGGGAPCDFRDLPIDNTAVAYFLGGSRREVPDVYQAASPVQHASAGDVPTLLIHGTADLIVPASSSRKLYQAQLASGVESQLLTLDGMGHMLTFINPRTLSATTEFLLDHLTTRTLDSSEPQNTTEDDEASSTASPTREPSP